jgi:alpha-beta hydrolase superfamily lysophospholipase
VLVYAFVLALWTSLALAGTVKLKSADGTALSAIEHGTGARGVVLVHGDGRTAADWNAVAGRLAGNGFHVLAIDLRGAGGSPLPAAPIDADWGKMPEDVLAAVAWLRGRGATDVALVGADTGGSVALAAGAGDPAVTSVTILSPAVTAHGLKITESMTTYGKRPILFVAANGDTLSSKAAGLLEPRALGPKQLRLVEGSASGVALFANDPELEAVVVGWLNGSWKGGDAAKPASTGIKGPELGGVDSKGTKLGE